MFKRLYAATVALGTLGLVLASAAHAEPVQVDLIIQNSYNYPGFSLHDELALYVANGLTPREALEASVINGPALMGEGAHYGSVEAGKVADLIVLEANPLEDIAATRQIRTVVLGGRVHDLEALQQLDADIRAKVAEARAAIP